MHINASLHLARRIPKANRNILMHTAGGQHWWMNLTSFSMSSICNSPSPLASAVARISSMSSSSHGSVSFKACNTWWQRWQSQGWPPTQKPKAHELPNAIHHWRNLGLQVKYNPRKMSFGNSREIIVYLKQQRMGTSRPHQQSKSQSPTLGTGPAIGPPPAPYGKLRRSHQHRTS